MSLVFLGYIVSAFLSKPDWGAVAVGLVKPTFRLEHAFLFTLRRRHRYDDLALHAGVCAVVRRRKRRDARKLQKTKTDVWVGTIFAILIVFFIVVSTAATLHKAGIQINTAADAAHALRPLAGRYAQTLFGLGLFGASMLAAGVLPLATAYSISEALGF